MFVAVLHSDSSCNRCISDDSCGFCYQEKSDGIFVNNSGSCLPVNALDLSHSTIGRCSMNNNTSDTVWALNFCPSSFGYMALIGMVSCLLIFGQGIVISFIHTCVCSLFYYCLSINYWLLCLFYALIHKYIYFAQCLFTFGLLEYLNNKILNKINYISYKVYTVSQKEWHRNFKS